MKEKNTCKDDEDAETTNKAWSKTESQKHCVIGASDDISMTSAQLTDGLKWEQCKLLSTRKTCKYSLIKQNIFWPTECSSFVYQASKLTQHGYKPLLAPYDQKA